MTTTKSRLGARWAILLIVAALVVSGCESRRTVHESTGKYDIGTAGLTKPLAPSATAGGILRLTAGNIDSLDPARSSAPWVWNLMRLYTRTLVTYGGAPDDQSMVPDLATDTGQPSVDLKTWTFTLKPGSTFDDGTPITSTAVKYGIERNFAADTIVGGPPYLLSLLDTTAAPYPGPYGKSPPDLTSIQTPDAATIIFSLNRPYADFRQVLTLPSAAPVPQARDTGKDYAASPASSGPYKIQSIDSLTGITFIRNPRWSAQTDMVRTALPAKIIVQPDRSQIERDQAVLSGAADLDITGGGVSPRTERRISASKSLAARSADAPNGRVRLVVLPTYMPPFDKIQCRQVVAAALNRGAIVKALGGSIEAMPLETLYPSELAPTVVVPSSQPPPPDPATIASCWPPGTLPMTIAVPNSPADLGVASAIVTALKDVGIASTPLGADPQTYYSKAIGQKGAVTNGGYSILTIRWSADFPSITNFLSRLVDSRPDRSAGSNFAGLSDQGIDAVIDKAQGAADSSMATTELVNATQAASVYVPLVEERSVLLAGSRLRNVAYSVAYHGYDIARLGVGGSS
ncbi:MAG: ABC transporter substrate-binding protein [Antricoccus sp.]